MTAHNYDPKWLSWAKDLQALAQTGLHFSENTYDRGRYETIQRIAAEIMAEHSSLPPQAIVDLFSRDSGYATPKVDVRAAAFQDGRLLMVKERTDGLWTIPGGWADVNESPREGAEREALEESGFTVHATKLAAVFDRSRHPHFPPFPFHVYKLVFLCEIMDGEPTPNDEIEEVGFFAPDGLPPLSITRITEKQIHRLFEHAESPAMPTDYD